MPGRRSQKVTGRTEATVTEGGHNRPPGADALTSGRGGASVINRGGAVRLMERLLLSLDNNCVCDQQCGAGYRKRDT